MRALFFTIIIGTLLWACNNNITTIGDDLIDNGNYVESEKITIRNIATVKIDSFVASSGYASGSYALSQLFMGRYEDNYSGKTTAIPCFAVTPSYKPSISDAAVLDSVTFHFSYAGNMWGDTLKYERQKFSLYRLDELPYLDKDQNYLLYNNYPLPPHSELLSEGSFFPSKGNIDKFYFKLDNFPKGKEWSEHIFDHMTHRGEDNIFNNLPWSFLNLFKGLVIIPDAANNCILNINASSESLYLRFHYHIGATESSYDIPLGQTEYMYNSIVTDPEFPVLNDPQKDLPFDEVDPPFALIQGLSGYMVKMTLPRIETMEQYVTLLKAEIEFEPEDFIKPIIPIPQTLAVYKTNEYNDILGVLYNNPSSNLAVTGIYQPDPANTMLNKYYFDVTDYYQRIASGAEDVTKLQEVLITIPNLSSSFNRAVIIKYPVLKLYYAKYKNN